MFGMGAERIWILFLFPAAVVLLFFFRRSSAWSFPTLKTLPDSLPGKLLPYLRSLILLSAIFLLSLAGAGLFWSSSGGLKFTYGADIFFIMDESDSMNGILGESVSQDFYGKSDAGKKNRKIRITEAKKVIRKFIEERKISKDRYGLVVFGGRYVRILSPTSNHDAFLKTLDAQQAPLGATYFQDAVLNTAEELGGSVAVSRVLIVVSDDIGYIPDIEKKEKIK